ncbi:hypothetical protein G6F68_020381 [Rhizopus microsporus]|nr:hypothetical protein G6F68_020381 [Rhizopus microsporus]
MAARLTDGAARDEETRPLDRAFVHRALQPPARTARIANGSEAPAQHRRHDGHRAHHDQRIGQHALRAEVQLGRQHVHVQVDQPRHQRRPRPARDGLPAGRPAREQAGSRS